MRTIKTLRSGIGMVSLFLILFIPWTGALAQWGSNRGWHTGPALMGGIGMGWYGGIFMIVFWIIVLLALVLFIKWLIQSASRSGSNSEKSSRALEILKERYARGDINRVEFETMKTDLSN